MGFGSRWTCRAACVLVLVASAAATASERQVVASVASTAARSDSLVVASLALHVLVPGGPGQRGAGWSRLLRDRLEHDSTFPLPDGPGAFDELLPDGGRLPIVAVAAPRACPRCPADAAGVLLDGVAFGASPLARSGGSGLTLELRDITWARDVRTEVVGRQSSAYASGRRQEGNPEFERLKVRLIAALADRQQADEESRNEEGFLGLLASLHASACGGEVKRLLAEVERTPPFLYDEIVEPYTVEVTEARAAGTLTALAVLTDPVTGWCDSLPVTGAAEQRASGLRGVRAGDTQRRVERDAVTELPSENDLLAAAFQDLRGRAAGPLTALAARAALRRAAREQDRGRGAEALGWLLLARDCGAEPPASSGWRAALTRARTRPYARLADVRLAPVRLPAR